MEGMGLKFAPVIVRHLLVPLSMFGPMAGTSWTHSYIVLINSPNIWFNNNNLYPSLYGKLSLHPNHFVIL